MDRWSQNKRQYETVQYDNGNDGFNSSNRHNEVSDRPRQYERSE